MSLFYGLTGGIGSGKSTVARMFAALGVPTLDLDEVGKTCVMNDDKVLAALVLAFGKSILDHQGKLVRTTLASVAFSSQESTKQLNAIIHPAILAAELAWREQQHAPFCVIEASVLIESDGVGRMDGLIVVVADENIRQARVLERETQSIAMFNKIIQRQCSDRERSQKADFTIENERSLEALKAQIYQLHDDISLLEASAP